MTAPWDEREALAATLDALAVLLDAGKATSFAAYRARDAAAKVRASRTPAAPAETAEYWPREMTDDDKWAWLRAQGNLRALIDFTIRSAAPPPPGRDGKDYAIEFGRYLATAADGLMETLQFEGAMVADLPTGAQDAVTDAWRRLASAIHEFRKRIPLAAMSPAPQQEDADGIGQVEKGEGR